MAAAAFVLLLLHLAPGQTYHCSNDSPVETPHQKLDAHSLYAPGHVHRSSTPQIFRERALEQEAAVMTSRGPSTSSPSLSSPPMNWPPPTLTAVPLPLSSVQLTPGGRGFAAQNLSIQWMHSLDPDRLLFSFRETANLSTLGVRSYGGWESSDCLLRGHIAGGHWLSAAALLVNGTGDATLKAKATYLVGELGKCQAANTAKGWVGYLSAFPPDHFDRLETNVQPIWAPYYTMHKILQGLYDMHTLAGDTSAPAIALAMLQYFAGRIRALIARDTIAQWYAVMNVEHGGMNEVAFRWATLTGDPDAHYLARMFDEPCWLGPLSLQADILTDEHANTHLPLTLGAATQYEGTGDHGGEQQRGVWGGPPHRLGDELDVNGVESCSTYNALKLSRQLFGWDGAAGYLNDFERAKHSGMYGTQHPTNVGEIIYLMPLRGPNGLAGGSKAHTYWGWSDPEDSMWCCVGSALESHSKHGDSLFYTSTPNSPLPPTLFVGGYDNAVASWSAPATAAESTAPTAGAADGLVEGSRQMGVEGVLPTPISITSQATWSNAALTVTLTLAPSATARFSLALRVPSWMTQGQGVCTLNGVPLGGGVAPPWVNITQVWEGGGRVHNVSLSLPFLPALEPLDDDRPEFSTYFSVTVGPFVLGALTRTDNVIVGSNATTHSPPWVRPVTEEEVASLASLASPTDPTLHIRHDNVTGVWVGGFGARGAPEHDEGEADASFFMGPPLSPTATTAAAAASSTAGSSSPHLLSIRSLNRPGEYLSCPAPHVQCTISHGHTEAFNASATWVQHSPGLSGVGVSYESVAFPGLFLSSFASPVNSSTWGVALSLQGGGGDGFNAASTFAATPPLFTLPTLAFIATTGDDTVAGSRDLLLIPIADIADDFYGIYLQVWGGK